MAAVSTNKSMSMAANPEDLDQMVRLHIYQEFLVSGQPPSVATTATALGIPEGASAASYDRLAKWRVIVLRPGTREILMAPPLSAVPTRFLVQIADGRRYYANCVWDALGVPAMLDQDANVEAVCGDCAEALGLTVRGGRLVRAEGVVHFAIPAAKWWDDIVLTCSTMLLFLSDGHVDAWCRSMGMDRGAIFTPSQMWFVAKAWYRNRLGPEWHRFTVQEAQDLFGEAGLTGPFWLLSASAAPPSNAA
jgi:alkylmercury lyase-like protein